MGWELVVELEATIKEKFNQPGAEGYVNRLLKKIHIQGSVNELVDGATFLQSVDWSVALSLLALDDLLDKGVLDTTRGKIEAENQSFAGGSFNELIRALSSGFLNPSGIADDLDGFAPVTAGRNPEI